MSAYISGLPTPSLSNHQRGDALLMKNVGQRCLQRVVAAKSYFGLETNRVVFVIVSCDKREKRDAVTPSPNENDRTVAFRFGKSICSSHCASQGKCPRSLIDIREGHVQRGRMTNQTKLVSFNDVNWLAQIYSRWMISINSRAAFVFDGRETRELLISCKGVTSMGLYESKASVGYFIWRKKIRFFHRYLQLTHRDRLVKYLSVTVKGGFLNGFSWKDSWRLKWTNVLWRKRISINIWVRILTVIRNVNTMCRRL